MEHDFRSVGFRGLQGLGFGLEDFMAIKGYKEGPLRRDCYSYSLYNPYIMIISSLYT